MKKDNTSCLLIILAFAIIPFSVTLSGYALSILWGWFIVPQFHLEPMRVPYAIGLSTIINYITYQRVDCEPKDESSSTKILTGITMCILRPLIALAFGWVLLKFV